MEGKSHEIGCRSQVGENRRRFKSHLTKASPAGQECHSRAHPVMGVRSWLERGGRPRDGAPQWVESWTKDTPQGCTEGKADGFQWPEGSRLGHARASVQDTTGV